MKMSTKFRNCCKTRNYMISLSNPSFKQRTRVCFVDDAQFQSCTLDFLDFLVENKRIDIIMDIMEEFRTKYNELTDTQDAVVTSALKLWNHQMAQIAKKIQLLSGSSNVRLKNAIETSLISGFIINYEKYGKHIIRHECERKIGGDSNSNWLRKENWSMQQMLNHSEYKQSISL